MEEVIFVRDDLAALGWAIEKTLQSPMDAPVDGQEAFLRRLRTGELTPAESDAGLRVAACLDAIATSLRESGRRVRLTEGASR